MLLCIIILFIILNFILITSKYESFTSLEKMIMELRNPNINKIDILEASKNLRAKSSISLSNKNADDKLITNFISKQLGKEDKNIPGDYNTHTDMLKYPKKKEKNTISKVISKNKMNYEDKIEEQKQQIKTKKEKQDLILRNIKYELIKLNEYRKPIHILKKEYLKTK